MTAGHRSIAVTLAEEMEDGVGYSVQVMEYCFDYFGSYCDPGFRIICSDPSYDFLFDSSVATLLSSFDVTVSGRSVELSWQLSSIDQGVEFVVFRQEDEGTFTEIERGLEGFVGGSQDDHYSHWRGRHGPGFAPVPGSQRPKLQTG